MTQQSSNRQTSTDAMDDMIRTVQSIVADMNPAYERQSDGSLTVAKDADSNVPEPRQHIPSRIFASGVCRLTHRALNGYTSQRGNVVRGAEQFLTDMEADAEEAVRKLGDRDPDARTMLTLRKAEQQQAYVAALRRMNMAAKELFVEATAGQFSTWTPEIDEQLMNGGQKPNEKADLSAKDKQLLNRFKKKAKAAA